MNAHIENKTCAICGTSLTNRNKRFCSLACRTAKVSVACIYPGCAEVTTGVRRSQAARGDFSYCSVHRHVPTRHLWRERPGYTYVAYHAGASLGKVGVTTNPKRRVGQLGAGWQMLMVIPFATVDAAEAVEAEALEAIGESPEVVVLSAQGVLVGTGATELFHYTAERGRLLERLLEARAMEARLAA